MPLASAEGEHCDETCTSRKAHNPWKTDEIRNPHWCRPCQPVGYLIE